MDLIEVLMDTGRCRTSRRLILCFVLLSATLYNLVSGGPDHHLLAPCADLLKSLRPDQRHTARELVQALQALDSYAWQLDAGRTPPASSANRTAPTLETLNQWQTQNASKLHSLLETAGVGQRLGSSEKAVKLAQECLADRLHPDSFAGRPTVSILLNYFKRPAILERISATMRASCAAAAVPCELIVNVDNPEEAGPWAREVVGRDSFVVPVFSANMHEARGYNRAAKLARGRYLVVWQDDQIPPTSGKWLVDMIKVFDANPLLGILGMNTYRLCKHTEPTNRWGSPMWQADPKTGVVWTYAHHVDFAPLAIRASIFRAIGGLDEGTARRGDCGIWGDWELCARTLMDGWLVGFMPVEGRSGDGESGTTHQGANGEKCWGRQQHVAMLTYHRRYGVSALQDMMCERVWLLNMLTFKPGKECPYGSQLTRYGNCTAPPQDVLERLEAELAEQVAVAKARGTGGSAAGESHGDSVTAEGMGTGAEEGEDAVFSQDVMDINPALVRGRRLRQLR